MDKFIIHTLKSESFQMEALQMFTELVSHIDKLAPCESRLLCPNEYVIDRTPLSAFGLNTLSISYRVNFMFTSQQNCTLHPGKNVSWPSSQNIKESVL